MVRTRKTMAVGDLIGRTLRRVDPTGKRHGARAIAAWTEVVGPDIDRHTRDLALRPGGELVVYVDSPAWATQLSLMSGELVERLAERLGDRVVKSLRFTVSRKVRRQIAWETSEEAADAYYRPDDVLPLALDPAERAHAEELVSDIPNDRLKEVALRIVVKDLELKKGARQDF